MSTQYASRAPLFTAWAVANLPDALSIDTTQVIDGPPTEANMGSTCVILGDVEHDEDWAAIGARNRNEQATIKCCIYIRGEGKTQTEVVEAAYALHGLIDLYLRDQISAIATVAPGLWEVSTRRTSMAKSQSDNARMAYLAFDIRIQSRI